MSRALFGSRVRATEVISVKDCFVASLAMTEKASSEAKSGDFAQGGGATEPLLRALGIPYAFLDNPAHVAKRIAEAQTWANASLHPAALLLTRELMWEES